MKLKKRTPEYVVLTSKQSVEGGRGQGGGRGIHFTQSTAQDRPHLQVYDAYYNTFHRDALRVSCNTSALFVCLVEHTHELVVVQRFTDHVPISAFP